jgi:hypothetical protein
MPRTVIKYRNTKIYKLVCRDLTITEMYVGHTTNFSNRKRGHKSVCCNAADKDYNAKVYRFIREHGGWDNWDMILVEKYPCEEVNEARARERYWIETLKPSLNILSPIVSLEQRQEYLKRYNEENKEYLQQRAKEYREKNKERLKVAAAARIPTEKTIARIAIYNQNNKEKVCARGKIYREEHKEKFVSRECACGGSTTLNGINRHEATQRHQNYIRSQILHQDEEIKSVVNVECQNSSASTQATNLDDLSAVSKTNDAISCETDTNVGESAT